MKRLVTTLFLGALLSLALPVGAGAQTLLFDYLGFDYEDPNPVPATFGEFGSGYVGLGTVPNLFAPLVADVVNNEYTYVMSGLTVTNITPVGTYLIIDYSPGTISIYEDSKASGTAADFGSNPPGPLAPPTFVDGTLFLQATLANFQFVVNSTNGNGGFNADMTVTGGSQLVNFPLNQRKGWTFAGSTGLATNIPDGYYHQIDGQSFLDEPVPTRTTSWGRVKSLYR